MRAKCRADVGEIAPAIHRKHRAAFAASIVRLGQSIREFVEQTAAQKKAAA